ncbi:hypothetical protein [Atopobium sp. oral taxon 810]|uniref:hypothetical protein n=1 Tax=Atopobium sp. oral taxon 810 TaxID=712158 RepID=UPI00039776DB|nr:hypothetical protein [Atopobium sp. oral taxon 810]ERI04786.1 hypothetical protein HMPREF9069_01265 [Atopobium sp. oral taxon 810 str. F0209]
MFPQSQDLTKVSSRVALAAGAISVIATLVTVMHPDSFAVVSGKSASIGNIVLLVALVQLALGVVGELRYRSRARIDYHPSLGKGVASGAFAFVCLALDYVFVSSFYSAAFGTTLKPVGSAELFHIFALIGFVDALFTLLLGAAHAIAAILVLREEAAEFDD